MLAHPLHHNINLFKWGPYSSLSSLMDLLFSFLKWKDLVIYQKIIYCLIMYYDDAIRNHKNSYRFISQYIDVIITFSNIFKYKSVNSSIAPVSLVYFRDVTLAISPFEWLWTDIYVQIFWQRHLLNSMIRPSFLVLSSLWGA